MNIKIGDRIKVIGNKAGHGYPIGEIFTVKSAREQIDGHNKFTEIRIKEGEGWLEGEDVIVIHPPSHNPGRFIITDPAFLMNAEQFKEIKYNHEKFKEPDFEHQSFPFKSIHNQTKEPVIFHLIETTPYGRGDCEYKDVTICNDSGMLCIAENENNWLKETFGIKFETLKEAQDNFANILNKF